MLIEFKHSYTFPHTHMDLFFTWRYFFSFCLICTVGSVEGKSFSLLHIHIFLAAIDRQLVVGLWVAFGAGVALSLTD